MPEVSGSFCSRAGGIGQLIVFGLLVGVAHSARFKDPCTTDSDCVNSYGQQYTCDASDKKCRHEVLFPFKKDIEPLEMTGIGLVVLFSGFSNMGGIGGNAFFAPICIWLLGYTVQEAGAISKAAVMAGLSINVFLLLFKVHPEKANETLIDFGLSAVLFPILLAGTMVGVTLNKVLPPVITLILPTIFLWKTSYSLFVRARKAQKDKSKASTNPGGKALTTNLLKEENKDKQQELTQSNPKYGIQPNTGSVFKDPQKAENYKKGIAESRFMAPQRPFSLKNILLDTLVIIVCMALVTASSLLRGGQGFSSIVGLESCGWPSWTIYAGVKLVCFLFSFIEYRRHIGRLALPAQADFHRSKIKKLMLWTYMAGIVSSFIGIGSGLILSPVMIGLEFLPEVASSIAAFSAFFTSASTTFQFFVQGAITLKDTASLMMASALGSAIGIIIIDLIYGKKSKGLFLLWMIFALALASSIAVPIAGVLGVLERGEILAVEYPC